VLLHGARSTRTKAANNKVLIRGFPRFIQKARMSVAERRTVGTFWVMSARVYSEAGKQAEMAEAVRNPGCADSRNTLMLRQKNLSRTSPNRFPLLQ
jgi:hypothetical protein